MIFGPSRQQVAICVHLQLPKPLSEAVVEGVTLDNFLLRAGQIPPLNMIRISGGITQSRSIRLKRIPERKTS
jgi:hypothetical protein